MHAALWNNAPLGLTQNGYNRFLEQEGLGGWRLAKKLSRLSVLPIAGVLVIVLYCAFTLTSIVLFPRPVSPLTDWLSDLGNSGYNPRGAAFYNVGCVLTGLALFPFFVGIYYWYTNERWRKLLIMITQAAGFGAAFALMMIGVFSEEAGTIHHLWSVAFFVLNLIVLILANVSLMTHPKFIKPVGYYGLIVGVLNLLFVGFAYTSLLEWFTVFTALGYVALLSYNTFTTS